MIQRIMACIFFSSENNIRRPTKHPDTYFTDIIAWLAKQNGLSESVKAHEELAQLALVGVNVINMADGRVLEDQILVIDNDTIRSIFPQRL